MQFLGPLSYLTQHLINPPSPYLPHNHSCVTLLMSMFAFTLENWLTLSGAGLGFGTTKHSDCR